MSALQRILQPKILIVGIVVLLIAITPFVLIDNTDNTIWTENDFEGNEVIVKGRRFLLDEPQKASLDAEYEQKKLESVKDVLKQTLNTCLGGKDPKKMTTEEQVKAFNNGQCNPTILIPGLAGTVLQVVVDCEKLSSQSPDVFSSCGWSTCSGYDFWKKKPDKEYRLWISSVSSPMGIIMASKKNHCFGDLIQLVYNPTEPNVKKRYSNVPGLKITYYGDTPNTVSGGQCGLGAIAELATDPIIKMMSCEHKGYLNIGKLLQNMGYISGLLFQSVPYDYRRSIISSNVPDILRQTINNLHQITGKKVVIITHSLGSLYALQTLTNSDQDWKDKKVATLLTMAGPYLGATKSLSSALGGDRDYLKSYRGHDFGINYYCQNKAVNSFASTVDIYPKTAFHSFQNETWMIELKARIAYETDYRNGLDMDKRTLPLDWFPGPQENCTSGFKARPDSCLTMMTDLGSAFLEIEGNNYTSRQNDILHVLDNYMINSTLIKQYYLEAKQTQKIDELVHPGVQTLIVYGAFLDVTEKFQYSKNPRAEIENKFDFYFPEMSSNSIGDGTVLSSSAITPAVKWIYEHKQLKSNKHATKLIEFCSLKNSDQTEQIYSGVDEVTGQRLVKDSGYFGLPCECIESKDTANCVHSCMINDKYIVELVSVVVQTKERSSYTNGISPFNRDELSRFLNTCQNLQFVNH